MFPSIANPSTGYIHSIETAGTVDGPGVRYVVFLTGCPLSCPYCHNPDAQKMKGGVLRNIDDILTDIHDYRFFLEKAKGGVTISGGEPLAQLSFTKNLLHGCKKMGLHTALDTSGFLSEKVDDDMLDQIDLVLLDIKSGIPALYKKVTGVPLQPTINFAQRLAQKNKPVWIRFVLVPGLTDSPDNIEEVANIAASLGNVEKVELLPFHKMGEYKWDALNRPYMLKETKEPTPEEINKAKKIFERKGLKVE